jgi:LPS sulfotransferase NodH
MYGQLGAYPYLEQYINDHEVSIVHLVRENYLDLVISNQLAWHTDLFHRRKNEPSPKRRVRIDVSGLVQELEARSRSIERMRQRCASAKVPVFEITYEQLIADQGEFFSVLEFLGVGSNGVALSSSLQKIVRTQASAVENYQEIADVLRGTRFEALLE